MMMITFSKTLLSYTRLLASQFRLSSVMLLHSTQRVDLFHNIFAPYCSIPSGSVVKKTGQKDNCNSFSSQGYYVQGSIKKSRFSTYISLHLANNRRYGNSYNGRQIENRMSSIGQCHFQWPWMTPNSDFLLPSRLNMYTSRNIWLSNLPISSCYKYDVFSAKNMVWQVPVITKRSFCLSCYMHLRCRLY